MERRLLLVVPVPVVFAPGVEYAAGIAATCITAADFNGDRKPDLALANSTCNSVTILLNRGNGTFGPRLSCDTGAGSQAILAADFNGDGRSDLAAVHSNNKVSILINKGGVFAAKVDYGTGFFPGAVASGDFNGDGKADLAIANRAGNNVSVLLNNGDGTFATAVNYGTGSAPTSVASADLNGDGKMDLVTAKPADNTVGLLAGNGDGTFAANVNRGTSHSEMALIAADLNKDGESDLALYDPDVNVISVLRSIGDGTFGPNCDYATGPSPRSVVAADFNGDGEMDLAAANLGAGPACVDGGVYLLLNNGEGTFAPSVHFDAGHMPLAMASADFNGDGTPDLAMPVANSDKVRILLNRTPPYTRPTITIKAPAARVDPSASSTINFTVTFSEAVADFTDIDVYVGGSATPSIATVTGSGTTYNVAVTGMQLSGTVTIDIPAAVATDASGHLNAASRATGNSVLYDGPPAVPWINYDPTPIRKGQPFSLHATALDPDPGDIVIHVDFYVRTFIRRRGRRVAVRRLLGPGDFDGAAWVWQGTSPLINVGLNTCYAIAYDFYGLCGVGTVACSAVVPPANDNFGRATRLIGPQVRGSNRWATSEMGEPLHAITGIGASLWWYWIAPRPPLNMTNVQITTNGSNFNTVLAVYTGTALDALTEVVSNDDNGDLTTSRVVFQPRAGVKYYIAVDGSFGSTGSVMLNWRWVA